MQALDSAKLQALVSTAINDYAGAQGGVMMNLGHKLGLFQAMNGAGPLSSAELARRSGCAERYVREWLNSQVAGGYLAYHPSSETYEMTPEQAMVLAAAAAVPATWGVASATSGSSPRLVDQPAAQVAPAAAAQAISTGPAEFVGITPVRALDTRSGSTVGVPAAGPLGADSTIDVQVAGINGVPAEATSVAINITIDVDATMKSFMTVWPTGEPEPSAWTIEKLDPIGNREGMPGLFIDAEFGAHVDNYSVTPNQ